MMTQGREQPDPPSPESAPSLMPAIQGVRPPDSFAGDITPFDPDQVIAQDESEDFTPRLDPWGVEDPTAYRAPAQVPQEPVAARKGGGILTIPLLCIGIAIIA